MTRTHRSGMTFLAIPVLAIAIGAGPGVGRVAGSDVIAPAAPTPTPTGTSTATATSNPTATATSTPTLVAATPTPGPTTMPGPTSTPSASAGPICGPQMHLITPQRVLAGTRVTGWFSGFEPNATVALILRPDYVAFPERALGSSTTDAQGYGEVDVIIPADAPIGDYSLLLRLEACATSPWADISITTITVVPVLPAISISDDTVVPGQRVTIRATGFGLDETVDLFLDSPEYLGHECCLLATAPTNADWSVVITVRLPRDLSPGAHTLSLVGWGPDQLFPEQLEVVITVAADTTRPVATVPPTDALADGPRRSATGWLPILFGLLPGIVAAALIVGVRRRDS